MSDDSAATLLLLLRLRAFAPSEVLASVVDREPAEVDAQLRQLDEQGWVQHRAGAATGWSLTAAGRRHGQELLRAELDAAGTRAEVDACYRGFLPLNSELLSVCTDWQTVDVEGEYVPNDHTDEARDAAVLARLDTLHLQARPVLDALADALARFEPYGDRLDRAHQHVRAGRIEWIAKPTVDSYHGIWFELHEHLLATLGRDRATERLVRYAPTHHVPTTNGESR